MKNYLRFVILGVLGFSLFSCGRSPIDSEVKDPTEGNNNNNSEGKPEVHKHEMETISYNEPTCTENGNKEYYRCKSCNKYFWTPDGLEISNIADTVIKSLGHKMTHFDKVDPNCEDDGHEEYYHCSRCDSYYSDEQAHFPITDLSVLVLSHAGHDLEYHKKVEATCTEYGTREYWHCLTCGKNYWLPEGKAEIADLENLKIEPLGHIKTDYILNDLDSHWYACIRCNEKIEPSEHTWDEGNEVVEGTCTSKHTTVFKCTICGQSKIDVEEPIGHDFSIIQYNETEHYSECSRCHVIEDREKHTFVDSIIESPSCTHVGNEHHECSICSYSYDVEIPITPHEYSSEYIITETEHYRKCATCDEYVDWSSHVWGNEKVLKAPTFSEEGLKEVSCIYCNYKKEVTLAKSNFLFMLSKDETYYTLLGFASCEENMDIVIPSTYNDLPVKKIAAKAFQNQQNINSVIVPNSVEEIGEYAFNGCSLTSITLSNNIKEIPNYCFGSSRLKAIRIPDSVKRIGSDVFWDCGNMVNIEFGNGLETIGSSSFYNCYNIREIDLPSSLQLIESTAFCMCSSVKEIDLPSSLQRIDSSAFQYCSSIESIIIGDNVNVIGGYAFSNCSSLKDVTIGTNVGNIGQGAFSGCGQLISATFLGPNNWYYQDEEINVSDPALNAFLLSKSYSDYEWIKK